MRLAGSGVRRGVVGTGKLNTRGAGAAEHFGIHTDCEWYVTGHRAGVVAWQARSLLSAVIAESATGSTVTN